jgi:hypothetical protein
VIARATVIVLLPMEQEVDGAADADSALALAAADACGLGGAYREAEAVLLAIARQALDGAPNAVLGMPAMKVLPGDAGAAIEALKALAERS